MTAAPVSDPDLTELAPLARVIADVVHTTPIHLGMPSPSLDLIQMLTLKVAAYIGREVLPPGSFDEARPPDTEWHVEARSKGRDWTHWSAGYEDRASALESCASSQEVVPHREFRVVRATTIYTIEQPATAEEQP